MQPQKSTDELKKILKSTHTKNAAAFLEGESDSFLRENAFSDYMRGLIRNKGLQQQEVFLMADVPERYGYKLLSEEKHTRQRDVILRLCYAAHFTLDETQKFLRMYELPELYAKIPRDALLMIIFREHTRNILEINELLKGKGFDPLRTSGVQD